MTDSKVLKIKINVTAETERLLASAIEELANRGIKGVQPGDLLSKYVELNSIKSLDDVIDSMTPIEYRVKEALLDEKKRRAIMKIIGSKDLSSKAINNFLES